jgi:mRNA interferase RelE/StbE
MALVALLSPVMPSRVVRAAQIFSCGVREVEGAGDRVRDGHDQLLSQLFGCDKMHSNSSVASTPGDHGAVAWVGLTAHVRGYTASAWLVPLASRGFAPLSAAKPKDAEAIEDTLDDLAEQPRPPLCKPLTGYPSAMRVRVGNYRICYTIDDGRLIVLVIVISTRDDVYRVLKRYLGR